MHNLYRTSSFVVIILSQLWQLAGETSSVLLNYYRTTTLETLSIKMATVKYPINTCGGGGKQSSRFSIFCPFPRSGNVIRKLIEFLISPSLFRKKAKPIHQQYLLHVRKKERRRFAIPLRSKIGREASLWCKAEVIAERAFGTEQKESRTDRLLRIRKRCGAILRCKMKRMAERSLGAEWKLSWSKSSVLSEKGRGAHLRCRAKRVAGQAFAGEQGAFRREPSLWSQKRHRASFWRNCKSHFRDNLGKRKIMLISVFWAACSTAVTIHSANHEEVETALSVHY